MLLEYLLNTHLAGIAHLEDSGDAFNIRDVEPLVVNYSRRFKI